MTMHGCVQLITYIRLGELIGSGQFGKVYSGILKGSNGEVEVAVKTLKEDSSVEDRVKFLQEAAIMGQFKHPNVVEMYALIKEDEQVNFVTLFFVSINRI